MELSKTKTSLYASLQSKKMRSRHGLFIAEGDKCVSDMLGSFELDAIVATPEWIEENGNIIKDYESVVLTTNLNNLKKISSLVSVPSVMAVFRIPDNCEEITLDPDSIHLLLDGVQDPGNLGTIIRTADWFGFHTIYASPDTADVFNPKTVQSTMGSLRHVKVVYTDLIDLIERNGIKNVYGLMLEGSDMFSQQPPRSGVIVMGNEGNGISKEMRNRVTDSLLIPPYDSKLHGESLNVGIATGITMAWVRQNK